MNIIEGHTENGFKLISFKDLYDKKCNIQESSLATEEAIWFGVEDAARMHLSREQVKELLPILQKYVDSGEL